MALDLLLVLHLISMIHLNWLRSSTGNCERVIVDLTLYEYLPSIWRWVWGLRLAATHENIGVLEVVATREGPIWLRLIIF